MPCAIVSHDRLNDKARAAHTEEHVRLRCISRAGNNVRETNDLQSARAAAIVCHHGGSRRTGAITISADEGNRRGCRVTAAGIDDGIVGGADAASVEGEVGLR